MIVNQRIHDRYIKFINTIRNLGNRNLEYNEVHHIIPRCVGGLDNEENLIPLTLREHHVAHWMLYHIYDSLGLKMAFVSMCRQNWKHEYKLNKTAPFRISSRVFERLKTAAYKAQGEFMSGKVCALNTVTGEKEYVTCEVYKYSEIHTFHTSGMMRVFNIKLEEYEYVSIENYYSSNKYITDWTGKVRVLAENGSLWVTIDEYYNNPNLIAASVNSKFNYIDQDTKENIKMTKGNARVLNDNLGRKRYKQDINIVIKLKDGTYISLENYDSTIHEHYGNNTIVALDTNDNKHKAISSEDYYLDPNRYITSTKGKVLAKNSNGDRCIVTKEEYELGVYVGQTKGLTTVYDLELNDYKQITQEEFKNNKDKFKGPCTGKVNVINIKTGIRSQILKIELTPNFVNLGNKAQYFKCVTNKTGKLKNISIFEWHSVKENFTIVDEFMYNKALVFKEQYEKK